MTELLLPDLKYSKDHEWVKVDGNIATIGITSFAQDQLGDIVYVELPTAGKEVKAGDEFGVVESVKSVSALICPVSGKVVETNSELGNASNLVNQSPYEKGWMVKVELSAPTEAEALLSEQAYRKFIESEAS